MCLGRDFFRLILFGVNSAFLNWRFAKVEKFQLSFLQVFFQLTLFFLSFCDSYYINTGFFAEFPMNRRNFNINEIISWHSIQDFCEVCGERNNFKMDHIVLMSYDGLYFIKCETITYLPPQEKKNFKDIKEYIEK